MPEMPVGMDPREPMRPVPAMAAPRSRDENRTTPGREVGPGPTPGSAEGEQGGNSPETPGPGATPSRAEGEPETIDANLSKGPRR